MGSVSDFFARSQTAFFRFFADTFFAKRYGHRAVVLETIAGVPGMVAGMWIHLKSLRSMKTGYGPLIRELLAEAENERMHLMFFIEIAKPSTAGASMRVARQRLPLKSRHLPRQHPTTEPQRYNGGTWRRPLRGCRQGEYPPN